MTALSELQGIRSDLLAALGRVDNAIAAADPVPRRGIDITGLERTKAIEWVLARKNGPMRPVEIWAELNRLGRNDPKMEVQVTTFDLWHRDRIGKIGRGQYITKSVTS